MFRHIGRGSRQLSILLVIILPSLVSLSSADPYDDYCSCPVIRSTLWPTLLPVAPLYSSGVQLTYYMANIDDEVADVYGVWAYNDELSFEYTWAEPYFGDLCLLLLGSSVKWGHSYESDPECPVYWPMAPGEIESRLFTIKYTGSWEPDNPQRSVLLWSGPPPVPSPDVPGGRPLRNRRSAAASSPAPGSGER